MDIAYVIATVLIALAGVVQDRYHGRTIRGLRDRLSAAEVRAAAADALTEGRDLALGNAVNAERRIAQELTDAHARYQGLLRQKDIDAAAERHALLERVQRPHQEPVSVAPGVGPRKMNWSEDDEVNGITPGQVAAAAGLTAEHERVLAHIDEIAVTEGVPVA